jgi:hypothetical protein
MYIVSQLHQRKENPIHVSIAKASRYLWHPPEAYWFEVSCASANFIRIAFGFIKHPYYRLWDWLWCASIPIAFSFLIMSYFHRMINKLDAHLQETDKLKEE